MGLKFGLRFASLGFPIPDPIVWLSFVASVTTRIKLGTAMLIVPQRNPVVTAKALATLDDMAGGDRVLAGVRQLPRRLLQPEAVRQLDSHCRRPAAIGQEPRRSAALRARGHRPLSMNTWCPKGGIQDRRDPP